MVAVRMLVGTKIGEVIEVDEADAAMQVAAGNVELAEPETPERTSRKSRKAAPDLETR